MADTRDSTRRVLLTLWFAFLWTLGMYWVMMEMFARAPADAMSPLKAVLLVVAGTHAAIVLYFRLGRIGPLLARPTPISPEEMGRVRIYYIICFAFSEAVALYGFVLRFVGSSRAEVAPFFIGAVALFLVCYPRLPEVQ